MASQRPKRDASHVTKVYLIELHVESTYVSSSNTCEYVNIFVRFLNKTYNVMGKNRKNKHRMSF